MATWKAALIRKVRDTWAKEFPFLKQARPGVVPYRSSNSIFALEPKVSKHAKWVYLDVYFTPKAAGEFTVEILVSETETTPESWARPDPENLSLGVTGCYRVGHIIPTERRDYWWLLKDNEGLLVKAMHQAGLDVESLACFSPRNDRWQPSNYELPIDQIMDESVIHLTQTVKAHVMPLVLRPDRVVHTS